MDDIIRARFARKVKPYANGCWIWVGAVTSRGYGTQHDGTRMQRAHRLAYEEIYGAIPSGMIVDHICFERRCVNPLHLRLVTTKQNAEHRRGANVNSKSGVRGVIPRGNGWAACVNHAGKRHYGTTRRTIGDAERDAIAMRGQLFTHDDHATLQRRTCSSATQDLTSRRA